MIIRNIRECKDCLPLQEDQGNSLTDAFLERVKADDSMVQEILNILASDDSDGYKVFEIEDIINHRQPISVQRGRFEWVG